MVVAFHWRTLLLRPAVASSFGNDIRRGNSMTIKPARLDLDCILVQIQMAEAGQEPVNPLLSSGLRRAS